MDQVKKYLPLAAAILLTIVFVAMGFVPKFTGDPNSVYMFTMLGAKTGLPFEPVGRYAIGAAELAAVALLWLKGRRPLGGLLAMAVLGGAILFHVSGLVGIDTQFPVAGAMPPFDASTATEGDGGMLFIIASIAFVAATYLYLGGRRKA